MHVNWGGSSPKRSRCIRPLLGEEGTAQAGALPTSACPPGATVPVEPTPCYETAFSRSISGWFLGRAVGQSQAGRPLAPYGTGARKAALGLRLGCRELPFPSPRPPAALGVRQWAARRELQIPVALPAGKLRCKQNESGPGPGVSAFLSPKITQRRRRGRRRQQSLSRAAGLLQLCLSPCGAAFPAHRLRSLALSRRDPQQPFGGSRGRSAPASVAEGGGEAQLPPRALPRADVLSPGRAAPRGAMSAGGAPQVCGEGTAASPRSPGKGWSGASSARVPLRLLRCSGGTAAPFSCYDICGGGCWGFPRGWELLWCFSSRHLEIPMPKEPL